MIKIIESDNHRFIEICTTMLRLTRPQVHDFLNMYTTEHQSWLLYDHSINKRGWADLVGHANAENKTPAVFIGQHRPWLVTDNVLGESIDLGGVFLCQKGLDKYAAALELWKGSKLVDFLYLKIEGHIFVDYFDNKSLQTASHRGWIDLNAHAEDLLERYRDPPTPSPEDPWLGAPPLPQTDPEPEEPKLDTPEAEAPIHQRGRSVSDVVPASAPQISRSSRAPTMHSMGTHAPYMVDGPSTPEKLELQTALDRQFAQYYRFVSGQFVSTHIEEDRIPTGFHLATDPQGSWPPLRQDHVRHEAPRHESPRFELPKDTVASGPKRGTQRRRMSAKAAREKGTPARRQVQLSPEDDRSSGVNRGQASARPRKAPVKRRPVAGKAPPNKKVTPSKKATATTEDKVAQDPPDAGRAALTARLPTLPPGRSRESPSSLTNPAVEDSDQQEAPTPFSPPGATLAGYNSLKEAALVHDYTISGKKPYARKAVGLKSSAVALSFAEKPVAPDELRNLLNDNFGGHLKQPPASRAETGRGENKSPTGSVGGDEQEDMFDETANMVYPEAEEDSDYRPNKAAGRKKKPAAKKSGGATRTPKKKKVSLETQAKRPSATSMESPPPEKSQTRAIQQPAPRIKIVSQRSGVDSSHSSSSPSYRHGTTSQSSQETTCPPTPNTPFSKNEPLFGMDRKKALAGPLGRTDTAFYAWSAGRARFASVATRAQFAEKADRIVPGKTVGSADLPRHFETLRRMREAFEAVEAKCRAEAAQDANEVEFAGCADEAVYAAQAEEAVFALIRGRRGEDEDTPMPDAPGLV